MNSFNTKKKLPQYAILFCLLLISIFPLSNQTHYIVIFATFAFCGFFFKKFKLRLKWLDFLPLFYILPWIYGAFLGVWLENKIVFVISNFAGMSCYLFYYFLVGFKVKKRLLIVVFHFIAIYLSIVTCSVFLLKILGYLPPIFYLIFGEYKTGSSTGQIRLMQIRQLFIFGSMFSVLFSYFYYWASDNILGKFLIRHRLIFLTIFFCATVIVPASKGYMLSFIMIFVMIFFAQFQIKKWQKMAKTLFIICVSAILFNTVLIHSGYFNIISNMFAESDRSNIARYTQLAEIWHDLTFAGNGLGSTIPGYLRNKNKPYGFELTYINIVHKLGLVGSFVFLGYIITFFLLIARLRNVSQNKEYISLASGLFLFVFPSIGNPLLFAPSMVISHCVALYLIRN